MKYETGIIVEVIDLRGMGRVGAFRWREAKKSEGKEKN